MSRAAYRKWSIRNYQNRLLIFGIVALCGSVYLMQDSMVSKGDLIKLEGTLHTANIYSETVTGRYGRSSKKSELVFYLKGQNRRFRLVHNIGDSRADSEYNTILRELKAARALSVYVRSADSTAYEPKVFQITDGKNTILDFEKVRTERSTVTFVIFIAGLCAMGLFVHLRLGARRG